MKQNYAAYTSEDFEVWKILFERQTSNLNGKAASIYMEALKTIGFNASKIPDFDEVNTILKSTTGWELKVVPAIVPEKDFFELLSAKKFPATTWLRKKSQLDYLEEPDMFHDVFGHVPLLTNQKYVDFFQKIAELALIHINEPEIIAMLGRIYWFTIEFGLIRENDDIKVYGAGIISSFGETFHSLSRDVNHYKFHVDSIMNKTFVNSEMQTDYFVINSLEELYNSISSIEAVIAGVLTETNDL